MIKIITNCVFATALLGAICSVPVSGINSGNIPRCLLVTGAVPDQKAIDGFLNWINESVEKYGTIHIVVGDNGKGGRFYSKKFIDKVGAVIFIDLGAKKFDRENYFAIRGKWEDFVHFVNNHKQIKDALEEKVEWVFDDWTIIIPYYDSMFDKPNFGLDEMSPEEKNDFLENVMVESEEEYIDHYKNAKEEVVNHLKNNMELLSIILKPGGRFFSVINRLTKPIYSIYCEKFTPEFCMKSIRLTPEEVFNLQKNDIKPINDEHVLLMEKLQMLYDKKHIVWLNAYKKDLEEFMENEGKKDPYLYNTWKVNPEKILVLFDNMPRVTGDNNKSFSARCVVFTKK